MVSRSWKSPPRIQSSSASRFHQAIWALRFGPAIPEVDSQNRSVSRQSALQLVLRRIRPVFFRRYVATEFAPPRDGGCNSSGLVQRRWPSRRFGPYAESCPQPPLSESPCTPARSSAPLPLFVPFGWIERTGNALASVPSGIYWTGLP